MSSEWRKCSIGDLVNIKHGFAFSGEHITKDHGKCVLVTPGNFEIGGGFKEGNAKYFHGLYPEEFVFAPGDLIVTMTDLSKTADTLGYSAKIPREGNKIYLHNQRVGKVIAKSSDANLDFLYWVMRHKHYRNLVVSTATGSTVRHTSPSRILAYSFLLPPPSQQQAIAHILGTLDDKIELNRKTNETLEAMAKALFKSWFVDFDPVRAKAKGRPTGLPAEISDLFPDSFEDSELGEIPRGWEVGGLEEFLVLQRGFDLPAPQRIKGAYPVVAASGVSGTHNEPMAFAPGVVTGRSGVLGKVFYIQTDFYPLNTTLWAKEFRLATPIYGYFLLCDIDFAVFNAGSAVPTLNRNHLGSLRFPLPPKALVVSFTEIAVGLMKRKEGIVAETSNLSATRDALLPKLISGELRIPDAEKMLEEVGI
jgi:type I restriction enzyme S subunit